MNDKPITTLFMLMSVDGKISTGNNNERDFDKDLPGVAGVGEGLKQYYELEHKTDLFSLNTGRVMAKVGWNNEKSDIKKSPVSFIIIDNKTHLTDSGVLNLLRNTQKLFIVTNNTNHPAMKIDESNLEIISYGQDIDFSDLFIKLKKKGIDDLTIQSGGEMNALLIRKGLINYISVVVAPLIAGGRNTPTLVDGDSLSIFNDLKLLRPLELISSEILNNSYINLRYKVLL